MTNGLLTPLRTLKLTIAYDGTAYAGWQLQPSRPTVQETLERAIEKVTGRHSNTLASGRTDAGVHALGQVVAFRTVSTLPPEVLQRALNAVLPNEIAVLEAAETPGGFHPIRDAVRKRYRYVIHDGPVRDVFRRHFVWHYRYGRLDADAMQRAAAALLGTHDFSSFETSGAERKTSVRTVSVLLVERGRAGDETEGLGIRDCGLADNLCSPSLAFQPPVSNPESPIPNPQSPIPSCRGRAGDSDLITIEVESNGFLYNMVRTVVGTLVEVGRGKRPESWPGEVLRARDRQLAGPTAPPQGLFLVKVEY